MLELETLIVELYSMILSCVEFILRLFYEV